MAESSTRAVDRALMLLAAVCEAGAINLVDAAKECELAPSTALRLLRTLESTQFVHRDTSGTYRPGGRIIQLGAQSLSNISLIEICRPAMTFLVAQTGESAYLSVRGPGETALYIRICEGTHSVRHASWVGRAIPLQSTAAGAVLRDSIPETGFVVVQNVVESDVTAIAAPIRSQARVVAALSLVVPSYRVTPAVVDQHGSLLAEAAAGISSGITGRAPFGPQETEDPA